MSPRSYGSVALRVPQLPSLTAMRGVAALWVVIYHFAGLYFPALQPEQPIHLIDKGYLAVDMFFMLSGFVLTHVYWRSFTGPSGGSYRKFFGARIARLYPLHLFVLALFLATAAVTGIIVYACSGRVALIPFEGPRSWTALAANLFMLQGLKAGDLSWNYPAWSLSIEFIAYLSFPFWLPALWRSRAALNWLLGVALVAELAWLASQAQGCLDQWDGPQALLRCLPEFVLGTLVYRLFVSVRLPRLVGSDGFFATMLVGELLLLMFALSDLLVVLLFPVLMLAALENRQRVARIMNAGPLLWLGDVSYSVYLLHDFVQHVTTEIFAAAGISTLDHIGVATSISVMALMIGCSLLGAALTYRFVEQTGRRRLRALFESGARFGKMSVRERLRTKASAEAFDSVNT